MRARRTGAPYSIAPAQAFAGLFTPLLPLCPHAHPHARACRQIIHPISSSVTQARQWIHFQVKADFARWTVI